MSAHGCRDRRRGGLSTLNHTLGRYVRVFLELKGNYLYVYNYLIVTEKGGRGNSVKAVSKFLFHRSHPCSH